MAKTTKPPVRRRPRLSVDEALIALIIAAMEANGRAAPAELARAEHLVRATARFRKRPRHAIGAAITRMRTLVQDQSPDTVVDAACHALPARLRQPAFALVADVLLVDGRLDRDERRFLHDVASRLGLDRDGAGAVITVLRMKNRA